MIFPAVYNCLSQNEFVYEKYKLVPIRYEDRISIMKWRNEQMYHLRQDKPLTEKSQEGFQLIHQEPKDGADNKQIAFLHPQSTGGVLTEFCQDKDKIAVD